MNIVYYCYSVLKSLRGAPPWVLSSYYVAYKTSKLKVLLDEGLILISIAKLHLEV